MRRQRGAARQYPSAGRVAPAFEGRHHMKPIRLAFVVVGFAALFAGSPAFAQKMNADDMKWINQCISDNRGEPGGTPAIVRAYCICMNEKMSNNETRSITQWEKSHPAARKACDRQAGWK
jgi:hypothetical protein